ncbi:bifunctional glutamate N-acetyltransferase/amino-acid acetyltransferase ArgJ [Raoultibacter massiliensis]|uniref:bifunctional glutamate N-acetyltransferase/amino-acid acetyltransferase ArgJ n=1 Tax=Raoultibacter massiliensis TaxID=1852371 RepID=UPI000C81679C|nr:bifunctional glutamate N-acetyltransferase/amino-acid acetyltransferase ArgJ [Raoultibacter massiliensis]
MEQGCIRLAPPPGLEAIEGGGVTSARGFRACGMHAGIRKNRNELDLALVAADEPCAAAGMFTQNVFCSAPVIVSREHLDDVSYGMARAVLVNSGNANAATGSIGLEAARETASMAAEEIGCPEDEVLVASTGVIGVHLPIAPFEEHLPDAVGSLSVSGGHDAAAAIMTTDTFPKEYAVTYESEAEGFSGMRVTIGGMAKGSGMIMPNMATMISVLTTDAPLAPEDAYRALRKAVSASFNKVTVDSDTSTNDSCYLLASGKAVGAPTEPIEGAAFDEFTRALTHVCSTLARDLASDGEGATRLITVQVTGAADDADADTAARAVANSPLVKTAVFGHDANWGRIAMAIGKSGAAFRQEDVSIDIMGLAVCRKGLTVDFDEDEALRRFENPEIVLSVDLGAGEGAATVWTCDLTHDYVTINGDYRT